MKIILDEEEVKTLHKVAELNNTTGDKLYDLYEQIMASNLLQDLMDIARENEEELKRQTYELTLVMRAGCDYFGELAKIENYIKEQEGKVVKKELEGIKTLPYSINGEYRAEYCYYEIEIPKDKHSTLGGFFNIQDSVLRWLLIKQDDRKIKQRSFEENEEAVSN